MLKLFCPDEYVDNIYSIDLDALIKRNIYGILIDLDNTLLPWNSYVVDERLKNWIQQCAQKNIKLCIISNNKAKRIRCCSELLMIPAVTGSVKPIKTVFRKGLRVLGLEPSQAAVVGDQLLTDVFGAKRMGMYAILVKPISDNEFIWTKIMRYIERQLLKHIESNSEYPHIK